MNPEQLNQLMIQHTHVMAANFKPIMAATHNGRKTTTEPGALAYISPGNLAWFRASEINDDDLQELAGQSGGHRVVILFMADDNIVLGYLLSTMVTITPFREPRAARFPEPFYVEKIVASLPNPTQ